VKISVLQHESDPRKFLYFIWPMCDVWSGQGYDVEVVRGVSQPIRADLAFLHIDLTVAPGEYLSAVADCPRVVNRGVVDISKTLFSRNQVHSSKDWDGPVVVKTVFNLGGLRERKLEHRGMFGRLRDLIARAGILPLVFADWLDTYSYPIFASASEVPRGVFRNSGICQ